MNYQDFDLIRLRKLITPQLDSITCFNCCKYYSIPTTATCHHSLCYTCWQSRRTCPICASQVDKKALRLNSELQTLTEHAILLGKTFESLYDINLHDIIEDTDGQQHVKEWLANSGNQFSAPVTTSQDSTEETVKTIHQVTSEVQIHSKHHKVTNEPARENIQINLQQDDWDKIEEMPEQNTNKNLKNAVGPMDIETFDFFIDEKEYNTHNPRRSLRNKELQPSNPITNDVSSDKESGKSININSDKKSKQNWKNVKKMKKEFNKLNKKNSNKLNVSIEMCKKAKVSAEQAASKTQQVSYNIDENTPEIVATEDATKNTNFNNKKQINMEINTGITKNQSSSVLKTANNSNKATSNSAFANIQDINLKRYNLQSRTEENIVDVETSKIKFFKKGPFQTNFINTSTINAESNIKNKNTVRTDTDDIEITIKIGKTLTNITIQKNDVKVNINSDEEIQTSLGNTNMENEHNITHSTVIDPNAQHIDSNNVVKENDPGCTSQYDILKVQKEKSLSTKKNTTSAETSSVHFQITESEEKEFEDRMERVPFVNTHDKNKSQIFHSSKSDCALKRSEAQAQKTLEVIPEDPEFLNDVDIFESESLKEGYVQPLESTASAIIMSTVKSNVKSSQKNTNKRPRDICDTKTVLSTNKKIKMTQEGIIEHKKSQKENLIEVESENINYDAIMSQVFANVDADIENLQTTGTSTATRLHTQISNTQQPIKPKIKQDYINNKTSEQTNQKCSENVFSLLEKEDANSEIFGKTKSKPLAPNKHLQDNFSVLESSPNVDLANKGNVASQNVDFIEFGTPIQDDDDKSIVEETPQKTTSFLKSKNKTTVPPIEDTVAVECLKTEKNKSLREKGSHPKNMDIDDSVNAIINISDTVSEISEVRKSACETPLSIKIFFDKIKHKSTPLARKSLNFISGDVDNDPEETICLSSVVTARTTQEKEFMSKAFEQTLEMPAETERDRKLCVAGTCLTTHEQQTLRQLCLQMNWTFVETYTKEVTHLVVGVDEGNKAQRSVKYMCALAGGKWIVTYAWVEKCLQLKRITDEEPFEALDSTGDHGPRRSRLSKHKLFEGICIYLLPPFTIIGIETLKDILEVSGARVLKNARELRSADGPAMLLAELEHTQENRFTYLALELQIVPVNYEWALNCLGSYSLKALCDYFLCSANILLPFIAKWPPELILTCDE